MALNKSAVATEPTPAAATAAQPAPAVANTPPVAAAPAPARSAEERRVRGQVRMHAIIAGYGVGGALAATLGTSPASVREELHKLAAEVADKIESYSFHE